MNDFYIGYLPKAPDPLRKFVQRVITCLAAIAVIAAAVFVLAENPFANSYFEFGRERVFKGVVETSHYPTLIVSRPGNGGSVSRYLLVAPGKHGADQLVAQFAGQQVELRGQLIYRDNGTMIEVIPGSVKAVGSKSVEASAPKSLERVRLIGEIVDSKCYLGVMNPGAGKVHRDCASRCLSGGIPPLFIAEPNGDQYLLVDQDGKPVAYEALRAFIAERITVDGSTFQQDNRVLLEINPASLLHR